MPTTKRKYEYKIHNTPRPKLIHEIRHLKRLSLKTERKFLRELDDKAVIQQQLDEARRLVGDLLGVYGGIMSKERLDRLMEDVYLKNPRYTNQSIIFNHKELIEYVRGLAKDWLKKTDC